MYAYLGLEKKEFYWFHSSRTQKDESLILRHQKENRIKFGILKTFYKTIAINTSGCNRLKNIVLVNIEYIYAIVNIYVKSETMSMYFHPRFKNSRFSKIQKIKRYGKIWSNFRLGCQMLRKYKLSISWAYTFKFRNLIYWVNFVKVFANLWKKYFQDLIFHKECKDSSEIRINAFLLVKMLRHVTHKQS